MSLVHEFQPREEDHEEDVFVRAACSCGWEGGAYPEWEEGYQEAEDEYLLHEEGDWEDDDRS